MHLVPCLPKLRWHTFLSRGQHMPIPHTCWHFHSDTAHTYVSCFEFAATPFLPAHVSVPSLVLDVHAFLNRERETGTGLMLLARHAMMGYGRLGSLIDRMQPRKGIFRGASRNADQRTYQDLLHPVLIMCYTVRIPSRCQLAFRFN